MCHLLECSVIWVGGTWVQTHAQHHTYIVQNSEKHLVFLTILVLVWLNNQVPMILILQSKISWGAYATFWVGSVNLNFGRVVRENMINLVNQTAQLVGTSWD